MADFKIERWVANLIPGIILLIALGISLASIFYEKISEDSDLIKTVAENTGFSISGFLTLAYVTGAGLWGLSYWRPINKLTLFANRHEFRVVCADYYLRKRFGLKSSRDDNKWLDLLQTHVTPYFNYESVVRPENCYTIFENAMTAAYLHDETQLLKRIIWERELIGMLQCLILSFYVLVVSLVFSVVYGLCSDSKPVALFLIGVLVFSVAITICLVIHLRLRNKLLARDVVVEAMSQKGVSHINNNLQGQGTKKESV